MYLESVLRIDGRGAEIFASRDSARSKKVFFAAMSLKDCEMHKAGVTRFDLHPRWQAPCIVKRAFGSSEHTKVDHELHKQN